MRALILMVLWTWGLTPLWVNVAGTVLIAVKIILEVLEEQT